jgi:predicted  nucleic acid-binding Zn-ribbon protein
MGLREEIDKIVQLQKIDSKIYSLTQEKDITIPAKLATLKNLFEEKKKNLELFIEKIKQLQLKRKDRELELATKEEGVKKAQGQLYQLKSNKEYQAKLTEIASLKADVSILEEEVLRVLEDVEETDRKLKREKETLVEEEKKFKEEESRINSEIKKIEEEIKRLEEQRKAIIVNIDKNILTKYEKLLQTRFGLAIVPVELENCGACHMRVTPQTINEIKMYKDLVFCENCVRILYVDKDIEP